MKTFVQKVVAGNVELFNLGRAVRTLGLCSAVFKGNSGDHSDFKRTRLDVRSQIYFACSAWSNFSYCCCEHRGCPDVDCNVNVSRHTISQTIREVIVIPSQPQGVAQL